MTGGDTQVHGTCIALGGRAVLLRGPSGSGKSDLALRFLAMFAGSGDGQAALIADDRTALRLEGDRLIASAPKPTKGLMEIRGIGILEVANIAEAELVLVADLVDDQDIERMPDRALEAELAGVRLPCIRLSAFEASAPIKLKVALVGRL